jgi:hypothetical protein
VLSGHGDFWLLSLSQNRTTNFKRTCAVHVVENEWLVTLVQTGSTETSCIYFSVEINFSLACCFVAATSVASSNGLVSPSPLFRGQGGLSANNGSSSVVRTDRTEARRRHAAAGSNGNHDG